jgi:hypothetical protein
MQPFRGGPRLTRLVGETVLKCPVQVVETSVGATAANLQVIAALATDTRMRDVWLKLERVDDTDIEQGRRQRPSISVQVAELCCGTRQYVDVYPSVSRSGWRRRHLEIAETARRLAKLLEPDPLTSEELCMPEIFDAETVEWTHEDEELEPLLDDALTLEAFRLDLLLVNLSRRADDVAQRPPFLGLASNPTLRLKSLLAYKLSIRLHRLLGKWFDNEVASIVEVVTGSPTTAASVKQLRLRVRMHRKGIR